MAVRSYKSCTTHLAPPGPRQPGYMKMVRHNFVIDKDKRSLPPIRDVVATRTERIYHVQPQEGRFFKNYQRRQENMLRGHFSLDCQPYKIMGGDTLLLDPREIIIHVFRNKIDKKHLKKLKDSFDIDNRANSVVRKSVSEEELVVKSLPPLSNIFPRSVLWVFVKESEKLMERVRSSGMHFYEELVQKLLDEKYTEVIQDDLKNTMIVHTLSSIINGPPESLSSSRPPSLLSDYPVHYKESTPQSSQTMPDNEPISTFSSNSLAMKKNRRKCEYLTMLQYLHRTLDMLCNLPNKLLRSKVPLTRDVLLSLLSENKQNKQPTNRIMSLETKDTRTGGAQSPTQPHRNLLGKTTPSTFGCSPRTSSPRSRNITKTLATGPGFANIETWDDLVALHERQQKNRAILPIADTFSVLGCNSYIYGSRSTGMMGPDDRSSVLNLNQRPDFPRKMTTFTFMNSKQTLWQSLMNEKLSPVESSSDEKRWNEQKMRKGDTSPDNDAEIRMRKLAKNFRTCREVMDKELQYMLQKWDRKKISSFRFKFATLRHLRTLDFYEKHRLYVKQLDLGADPTDQAETEQCSWIMKLVRDTARIARRDSQLSDMLQKLTRFSYVDATTPTYGRAKLCLLLMSLPANELCEIYVQKALKFIVEDVLLCSKGVFKRWMDQRQIPSVIEASENALPPL